MCFAGTVTANGDRSYQNRHWKKDVFDSVRAERVASDISVFVRVLEFILVPLRGSGCQELPLLEDLEGSMLNILSFRSHFDRKSCRISRVFKCFFPSTNLSSPIASISCRNLTIRAILLDARIREILKRFLHSTNLQEQREIRWFLTSYLMQKFWCKIFSRKKIFCTKTFQPSGGRSPGP